MSMLKPKLECELHEDVLPWLMNQKNAFTDDQSDARNVTSQLIEDGILSRKKKHAATIKARADRIKQAEKDLAMAGVHQQQRRKERAQARETRAKEQAKTKMRDEIRKMLIDKAQVVNPAASSELLDIHGCYEKGGKPFTGSLGGQLQQMYYVVNAILKVFPDESELVDYFAKVAEDPKQESIKNPRNPRELLLENFFIPFLVTKIKELQCEYL
jgi:hypothetical protein